jgi:hypothetical protein
MNSHGLYLPRPAPREAVPPVGVLILSPLIARAADLASAKLRGGALVTVGGAGGSEQVDVDGRQGLETLWQR